jgi:hypothetical protein
MTTFFTALIALLLSVVGRTAADQIGFSGQKRANNLVSDLLDLSSVVEATNRFTFTRPEACWIFISAAVQGDGTARIGLDQQAPADGLIIQNPSANSRVEAMRAVTPGAHTLVVECTGQARVEHLQVRSIPELIHCGLGFDPAIKAYGRYNWEFLKADILPNITTLHVPSSLVIADAEIRNWHRQGKRFIGEVGLNAQAKTAEDHFNYWMGFYDKAPFLDGLIINEFIVNRPVVEWAALTPDRLARMEAERQQYAACAEAVRLMRADARATNKTLYAYIGGSGKKLNQEIIGTNFIRAVIDCDYRVVLERYLHEMSSEAGSRQALQTFVEGIADWEGKEPGVKKHMVIAFGLFSMPSGTINKQPNVDYHVWMDQQMNLVANHPALTGIAGLEWWTSSLADEETVRFVGKLYRHYGLEGKTNLLTTDPLFLTHIQNADFEKGVNDWTLRAAEESGIEPRSFPRYGRIEGRYMGLGRPPDPEHIGDTFLWMKRSAKGPNTFSQQIKDLQPGRLYSMKIFTGDYQDLLNAKPKKLEEAMPFIGSVVIEGAEVDPKRSFAEPYASSPEPKIPVWITYHWKVFRATNTTARLTVSDWPDSSQPALGFGQEQAFNFVEIQPYHP